MLFKEFYACPDCGAAISGEKTSYFVCPNCETPLCREEKLEELESHYCHECGYNLDEAKEKILEFKRTTQAIEKLESHFSRLVSGEEPKQIRGIASKGRAIEALQQLLWNETEMKEKFRLVIDYDPDFPLFVASLFDLNPINSGPKNDDFEIDHK